MFNNYNTRVKKVEYLNNTLFPGIQYRAERRIFLFFWTPWFKTKNGVVAFYSSNKEVTEKWIKENEEK